MLWEAKNPRGGLKHEEMELRSNRFGKPESARRIETRLLERRQRSCFGKPESARRIETLLCLGHDVHQLWEAKDPRGGLRAFHPFYQRTAR